MSKGQQVEIYTEVSDGQGDVKSAWIPGTVAEVVEVQPGFKAHGCSSGVIVNASDCAYKDKNIFVSDDMVSTVLR